MRFEQTETTEQTEQQKSSNRASDSLLKDAIAKTDKPDENLGREALRLLYKHGAVFKRDGDKINCQLQRNGEHVVLFTFEPGAEGLKEADKRLEKLSSEQQQMLEEKYHVRFSKAGDDNARSPRLNELYGIEAALQKSQPANMSADGNAGVKFHFLQQSLNAGDEKLAEYIARDKDGLPSVYIHPTASIGILISERDVARFGIPDAESSQEYLLTTELARHSLDRLGMTNDTMQASGLANQLGWTKSTDGKWSFTQGDIAPATKYISSPEEELTDAIALFRVNEKERAALLATSPKLYAIVKEIDQKDLNLAYGGTAAKPRILRALDGTPVSNTEETARQIATFENAKR
jgi:hypothetical protein